MKTQAERQIFTVTDLKQYSYCPRVVFYTYCLPLIRPTTYKMEAGIAAHERAEGKAKRRTLSAYGLTEGERHFDVWLVSETLGLRGRVDLVIETEEGELIPVEYKHTQRGVGSHIRRQLMAYAIMLEETWENPQVKRGFVYSLATRKATPVKLTKHLRTEVRKAIGEMREMVECEAMPDAPRSRRRCVNCEFRRFCNDVL
ncbi:CRISPR-associated protein Cas4 [candidate division KSB3 bacterium]|nr:CRISPR-associated protein Cas4 [candidate division KSB3 bacterium]